jgi:ABC-type phosphate transport system substrate-binding protein
MRGRRWFLVAVVAALVAGHATAAPEEVELAVIVNPAGPPAPLNRAALASIFSMTRRNWEDGTSIVPFNYPPESPMRRSFDQLVLGLAPAEVSRFWIDQRIRGQGHPPRHVTDPGLVLRLVANVKGGIGYVPVPLVDKSVRVVARVSKARGVVGP